MTRSRNGNDGIGPVTRVRRVLRRYWNDLLSVYYANTPIWRLLKSGALLFFGFFCWSGASLLLSYRPEWTILYLVMAYGFVLVFWGPLTHFVIVPLSIRTRRTTDRELFRTLAKHASKLNLSVFFVVVLVLATYPIGPMMLDFDSAIGDDSNAGVSPDVECVADAETVTCQVEALDAIDHVVVLSAGNELDRSDEPPHEFTIPKDDIEVVVGQYQLEIEVRDEDGETLRRHVRSFPADRR